MSYPPNPTPGVPAFITVNPVSASVTFGATLQLTPSLTDADDTSVEPTEQYTYSSSNTELLSVDHDGLCTASTPADLNTLTPGGIVTVTVTYPFANRTTSETISAQAFVTVTAEPSKTQALVSYDTIVSTGAVVGSYFAGYRVVPESAPAGVYPPGWSVTSDFQ